METLPGTCDLSQVGLDRTEITTVTLLRRRPGHSLFRLGNGKQSFVLKWFADSTEPIEPRAYLFLTRIGVPTLPVLGLSAHMLLLEDLAVSPRWRLADEVDIAHPETGAAIAHWYRTLHEAGRALLANGRAAPDWLQREVDALSPATIQQTGERLALADAPGWRLAVERIEDLQREIRALPTTLLYGDFHWTNLALSRDEPSRAIVFDYHLLGIGPRVSDCRNVCGSLPTPARSSFLASYGHVDEREITLDAPVAMVYALQIAAERPHLPGWARPLIHDVRIGVFDTRLRQALALC